MKWNCFMENFLQPGLPDQIIFSFNTQDFKLPKGVTFDYDDGTAKKKPEPIPTKISGEKLKSPI